MLREIFSNMSKALRWLGLLFVIVVLYTSVSLTVMMPEYAEAQEETVSIVCGSERAAEIYAEMEAEFTLAKESLDLDDIEAFVESLRTMGRKAGLAQAECLGLAFDSETLGMQPVIGPVTFPSGTYRVTATTDGFMLAEIEVISGDCDETLLFAIFEGDADDGSQTVFKSDDCVGLIAIGNTGEPWSLDFELLVAS
jgi:hypothetical protein